MKIRDIQADGRTRILFRDGSWKLFQVDDARRPTRQRWSQTTYKDDATALASYVRDEVRWNNWERTEQDFSGV